MLNISTASIPEGYIMNRLSRYLFLYRAISIPSLLMSIVCALLSVELGLSSVTVFCWLKIITTSIFLYFAVNNKRRVLYYYYNLSISRNKLIAVAFGLDTALYLLIVIYLVTCVIRY